MAIESNQRAAEEKQRKSHQIEWIWDCQPPANSKHFICKFSVAFYSVHILKCKLAVCLVYGQHRSWCDSLFSSSVLLAAHEIRWGNKNVAFEPSIFTYLPACRLVPNDFHQIWLCVLKKHSVCQLNVNKIQKGFKGRRCVERTSSALHLKHRSCKVNIVIPFYCKNNASM